MNLVDRVKNILITPKTEWPVVYSEQSTVASILTAYVFPLLLIGAIAIFIGQGLIGINLGFFLGTTASIKAGLIGALLYVAFSLVNLFILAAVIDGLAPTFTSEKNWVKSFQLAAYSLTPAYVGAFFMIYPPLTIIYFLCSLYCIYLLYAGIPVMKKTPAEKHVSYLAVIILVLIVVMILIGVIQNAILRSIFRARYGF